jgi:hypothetical protein
MNIKVNSLKRNNDFGVVSDFVHFLLTCGPYPIGDATIEISDQDGQSETVTNVRIAINNDGEVILVRNSPIRTI